uniref:DUF4794 domain-containing protein n=1 Tax=Anopheles culicifacies TaxID=139723 RepID=A0A182MS90_9DIPT
MKCIVVLVLAATALMAEGSVIPLALAPGYAIAAPAGLALPGATVIQSNPPATIIHTLPAPIAVDVSGTPTLLLAPSPAGPAVVAVAPAPAATAVSATRGAVHVAPLPGHSVSQTQLNLAAAPGTELALFTPYVPVHPLDEGYFPRPKYFDHVETGLLQEHPVVRFPDAPSHSYDHEVPEFHYSHTLFQPVHQHHQEHFLADKRYLSFVAPSASLVAYVPVHRGKPGPWAVPNVFIKGQGYSTNHYVAPTLMTKLLAQDPR